MSPACGEGDGRSLQSVSDQELERAVEANMRQRRRVRTCGLEPWRTEAQETIIGVIGPAVAEPLKWVAAAADVAIGEQLVEFRRQVAGKGSDLGGAIEDL